MTRGVVCHCFGLHQRRGELLLASNPSCAKPSLSEAGPSCWLPGVNMAMQTPIPPKLAGT